jgi:hypothetical protein
VQTVEQIRAEIEAAKIVAIARFQASTGCATAEEFVRTRLAPVIATSASPADAMRKALAR